MAKFFEKRNLRYGFVSVCITLVVIAVIVLFNVVLTALFKKYPLDIDLTEDRIFEISGETINFLENLDQDVAIYILNTESSFITGSPTEYFIQANEVIRKYSQYSSRVRLEYVDLIRNPDFPSRFPDADATINDILIVAGDKARKLSPRDLFNIQTSYYGSYISSSKAEQAMTSALLGVTSKKSSLAAVIGGHGELDVESFAELLRMNVWDVVTVNTITEPIPPEASLLILAAPGRDLSVEELANIDGFLEGGSNRIFFYLGSLAQGGQSNPLDQPSFPNLDAFLTEWGLAVDGGVVFETDSSRIIGDSPYLSFADFVEDDYSKQVISKGLYPVLPQSRPLRLVYEAQRYRKTQVLIRSSPSAGIRPPEAPLDWNPGPQDLKADIPLLALSSSTRSNVDRETIKAHVLVCGSVAAWNSSILGNINIANSGYFLDLLGRLSGREDQLYIEDKTLGFSNLNVTAIQVIILSLIFIVLVPLAVLVTGIVVWLRRRHR
ncbi:MAG: GldG family protein [Spirochaetaceae bacterium]|jgi:ABC-type uncharacterized transport system involved in gliding motility auxiliary subunit|nr:GldG family protein [Spirochaetaceae bacterium]